MGAKDRAGEIGLVDRLLMERDAEDRMGVWEAVEGYVVFIGGVQEEGERVGLALGGRRWLLVMTEVRRLEKAYGSSKREEGGKEGVLRFDAGMMFRDEAVVGSVVAGAARAAKKLGGRRSEA